MVSAGGEKQAERFDVVHVRNSVRTYVTYKFDLHCPGFVVTQECQCLTSESALSV